MRVSEISWRDKHRRVVINFVYHNLRSGEEQFGSEIVIGMRQPHRVSLATDWSCSSSSSVGSHLYRKRLILDCVESYIGFYELPLSQFANLKHEIEFPLDSSQHCLVGHHHSLSSGPIAKKEGGEKREKDIYR
jgi:hypothetical protein